MRRERLLAALMEQGLTVFSIEDARGIAEREGISAVSLPALLMRMTQAGWLARPRRGLYVVSGPLAGGVAVHPFAIAVRLVSPSAISHWSALHHHGLTEQVPRIVTAFTPRKVVTPTMRQRSDAPHRRKHAWTVDGLTYEYTTVEQSRFFGIEQVWVNEQTRIPITDRERTLLEMFASPRSFGGIGEGIGTLREHLDSLSVKRLVEYALRYDAVSVAKRLGWSLESAGVRGDILAPLLQLPSTGYHLIDPSGPRSGTRVRRWKLQNNLGVAHRV